ncbi:hypothetical protein EV653_5642 [Kribbella pratensis]|uniref:Uncharacterized protein n=2 Tax=Kribbella pratensis TaxID=2512112 RepID=A0A4R8BV37_9ACTN|nr:hypothetical protein EV653_5642 [Kribbella pratensis]
MIRSKSPVVREFAGIFPVANALGIDRSHIPRLLEHYADPVLAEVDGITFQDLAKLTIAYELEKKGGDPRAVYDIVSLLPADIVQAGTWTIILSKNGSDYQILRNAQDVSELMTTPAVGKKPIVVVQLAKIVLSVINVWNSAARAVNTTWDTAG